MDNSLPNTTDSAAELASPYARWARREQVQLDGVNYDIRVAVRGPFYYGAWVCWDCGEHGAGSLEHATPDQASTKALLGLRRHHKAAHRPPNKPK